MWYQKHLFIDDLVMSFDHNWAFGNIYVDIHQFSMVKKKILPCYLLVLLCSLSYSDANFGEAISLNIYTNTFPQNKDS